MIILLFFSCGSPAPRKPIVRKSSSLMDASVLFNKQLNEAEETIFKNYIKQDSTHTYITSSKGFWYTYNMKAKSVYLPKFGDELHYTFDVYNVDNTIIYSAEEVGKQIYVVDQQEIIEGLRDGLKLMKEGEIVTFLFPSHKVYSYLGDSKKIGINHQLIYKVQLNKINKKNENN